MAAPSRALARCASMRLRIPPMRNHGARCVRMRTLSCIAIRTGPSPRIQSTRADSSYRSLGIAYRRAYSSETPQDSATSSQRPEPPDYLSEGERKIFEKIRRELEPVSLQVSVSFSFLFPAVLGGGRPSWSEMSNAKWWYFDIGIWG